MTSSPKTELARLRDFVANVPEPTCFQESVRLLEEAFDYSGEPADGIPWGDLRQGQDIAFFGEKTLSTLFPEGFPSSRELFEQVPWSVTKRFGQGLRCELQRYLVVGIHTHSFGVRPQTVVMHGAHAVPFHESEWPGYARVEALELMRLRAGLMNRRQASLLANHLNRFGGRAHRMRGLNWQVVIGPEPDSSARSWLYGIARYDRLRHCVGEMLAWRLPGGVTDQLMTYDVDVEWGGHASTFTYRGYRAALPPRYDVMAQTADGSAWQASRSAVCQDAYSFARIHEDGGSVVRVGANFSEDICELWGYDQVEALPKSWGEAHCPARVYATAFSQSEAIQVMKELRLRGYRQIKAMPVGIDGLYLRDESGGFGIEVKGSGLKVTVR